MKSDQEQRGSVPYATSSRDMAPPLVTTEFSVIDDGEWVGAMLEFRVTLTFGIAFVNKIQLASIEHIWAV